jgi:hypothetical protein
MTKTQQLTQNPRRRNTSSVRKRNRRNLLPASSGRDYTINAFAYPVFGFPDRLRTQLRYSDSFGIASVTGAVGAQKYRSNSIYDPDQTNAGHQPLYFDTYAAIYDHYAVIGSTIKVELINSNTSTFVAGLVIDDDTTISSDVRVLCEQNHGMSATLTPLTGSSSKHTFTCSFNAARVLGIDPFTSQSYKTGIASNPTEESYFIVWVADLLGSGTTYLTMKVEIIYDVLFTELSTPTVS